jgi:hypothetical protein
MAVSVKQFFQAVVLPDEVYDNASEMISPESGRDAGQRRMECSFRQRNLGEKEYAI